jgi:hypothetical protein
MRASWLLATAVTLASASTAASAADLFIYKGTRLVPGSGGGVRGAKRLSFTLSGHSPAKGACDTSAKIVNIGDGANTLVSLLADGYVLSPNNSISICRDATGKLTESLLVNLEIYSGGTLYASYTWQSAYPPQNGATDTLSNYIDLKYYHNASALAGHLVGHKKA